MTHPVLQLYLIRLLALAALAAICCGVDWYHHNHSLRRRILMPESILLRRIFSMIGSLRNVRLFRNNVGQAIQGRIIGGHSRHGAMLVENPRRIN